MRVPAYLEVADRKVFASAVDWPGWCRSAKDEAAALKALVAYAHRYAVVAHRAGWTLGATRPCGASEAGDALVGEFAGTTLAGEGIEVDVVERLPGSSGTTFGVPMAIADGDRVALSSAAAERQAELVAAAWAVLGQVIATAPAVLRKGPRGGGRDRDAIAAHVNEAEIAYARKLGVRLRKPKIEELRESLLSVLRMPSDRQALAEGGWPARYGARRIAWHALDHAWEIEDRSS
ncbi:MAG: hypothetical protein M3083_16290 [Actinomycetota bacterium]|nr:hypothetical protein [Actinomycetota bacterium]